MTPPPRAIDRFGAALIAGNVAIAVLLLMIGLAVLVPSRQDHRLRARQAVENLSATLASEIASELRQVDNALVTVAQFYRSVRTDTADGRAALQDILLLQSTLLPQIAAFSVADAHGDVVLPSAAEPINVADRDYFGTAQAEDRMVFSAPLVDRVNGKPAVVVARRLLARDGGFQGVVFASLTTEHFKHMFKRLQIGSSGAITLRNDALQMVARHAAQAPDDSDKDLGSARVSVDLRRALTANRQRGMYATTTSLDGIERLTAYRGVDNYPLLLLAGLATDDYLSEWRRQCAWLTGLLGAVALATMGFSAVVWVQRRRQLQTTAQLQQIAREQAAMLNNELVGMVRVRERQAVWQNRALERIFGYGEGELDHHLTRSLYLDDASYGMVGDGYALLHKQGWFRTQLKMRRKDGSAVWIDLSGAPVSEDESLWMLIDISALKAGEEDLKHLALHDALTQLPNRSLFTERVEVMLAGARRSDAKTAVCFLDLDRFKPVNDTYGHDAGDRVLKEISARLQQCMREGDIVARIGGDEFSMALAGLNGAGELRVILERLLQVIAVPVPLGAGKAACVTASIGVALAPDQAEDLASLSRLADEALYAAKRGGRNRGHLSGVAAPIALGAQP